MTQDTDFQIYLFRVFVFTFFSFKTTSFASNNTYKSQLSTGNIIEKIDIKHFKLNFITGF